jgi:hypothetical protein
MAEPPGYPMPSGFDYRPVEDFPELVLSKEARQLVLDKMDSVAEARRRAMETADRCVIGAAPHNESYGAVQ